MRERREKGEVERRDGKETEMEGEEMERWRRDGLRRHLLWSYQGFISVLLYGVYRVCIRVRVRGFLPRVHLSATVLCV